MSEKLALRLALLDIGLEDLIALPEIPKMEEVGALARVSTDDIAASLVELLRDAQIQVWAGRYPFSPEVVTDRDSAEQFLRSADQYVFNSLADREVRIYYSNVENLRE